MAEAKKTPEEKRPEAAQTGAIRKKASGDEICMGRTRTYECLRAMAVVLFHTVFPVRYYGMEKARQEMPLVIISNHVHALDPALVAYPLRADQCFFLAKEELGKNRLVHRFLYRMHCIFVRRHQSDMEAMRNCLRVLKEKKPLVIFPEGTRHHEGQMEHIENGTALIVMRSRATLLPMYIDKPLKPFRRVNVTIGDPIPYNDLLAEGINSESCEKLNERMRETFRGMIAGAEKQK